MVDADPGHVAQMLKTDAWAQFSYEGISDRKVWVRSEAVAYLRESSPSDTGLPPMPGT